MTIKLLTSHDKIKMPHVLGTDEPPKLVLLGSIPRWGALFK